MIVRQATADDAVWMQSSFDAGMGWTKPGGYFAECCRQQAAGGRVLLVAEEDHAYRGHVNVVWEPEYPPYREQQIPEIVDLNVLPAYRRQGIGTQLLDAAERLIHQRSSKAGIGFGLYASYGPAQRMYVLRGYVPDGKGIMYAARPVEPGTTVRVDDDLVLYLVKAL